MNVVLEEDIMYSTLTPGQVVLNGGESTTLTAKDGTFVFRDVTPGVYLLEVLSTRFHYSTMRVTLDKTDIIAVEYKVGIEARFSNPRHYM